MTYNIHPLFVHFPIAFLLLYSILKILPFDKWFLNFSWYQIRMVILIAGVIGSFFASSTGEIAEKLTNPNNQILEVHSTLALISVWIYSLLLLSEGFFVVNIFINKITYLKKLSPILKIFEKIITNKLFTKILALLGIITISLTGLFGGIMVYGTSADPLAPIVLKLFQIQ